MKRTILASILGAAVTVGMATSTYGQGSFLWKNYSFGSSGQVSAPVTYNGQLVGSDFTAALMGSTDGTNFTFIAGSPVAFFGTTGGSAASGAGLFTGGQLTLPGYVTGNAYFILEAYQGSDYASASIRGESSVIVMNQLSTSGNGVPAGTFLSDNPAAITPLQAFTVSVVVPEPTTLALAGLGLASLLMFRRRTS